MEHVVALEKVVSSGPLPSGLTKAMLLAMINANIGSEEQDHTFGMLDWSFKGGDAFDYLQTGQRVTLSYTFILSDGEGGRIPFDVPVTIIGKHDNFLVLRGSDVTIPYAMGRGDLEIEADDMPSDVHNTLAFGTGIEPAMVGVEALPYPGGGGLRASDLIDSLRLTVSGSGKILLNDALRNASSGVQRVTFADGTVWSYAAMVAKARIAHLSSWPYDGGVVLVGGAGPDQLDTKGLTHRVEGNGGGDTFIYNRGYGLLEIIENDWANRSEPGWKANTLSFGAGVAPADVTVRMTGLGEFELSLSHGDLVVFHEGSVAEPFREYHDQFRVDLGGEFGLDAVIFADGTRWSVPDLVARQAVSNGVFYGIHGDSTLDTHGQSHFIASEGNEDRIVYNRGYGPLTIGELADNPSPSFPPHNVVVFGAGITADDLQIGTSVQDLCLSIGDKDVITIGEALADPGGHRRWGIEEFQFADGTRLSFEAVLARAHAAGAKQCKVENRSAFETQVAGWPVIKLNPSNTASATSK